jgi:hypothetical protein
MLQFRNSSLGLLGFAAAVALGAVACSTPAAPSGFLTTQQASLLSSAVALDAEGNVSDATTTGGTVAYTDAGPVGNVSQSSPVQCIPAPTRTPPGTPADADADGVPDSVRFTLGACVLTYPAETDTLRGTIDILDPTPAVLDHAVKRIFTSVVRARLRSGKLSYETANGTRMTTRDATTLTHTETNFRTDYVFPDGSAATHVRSWTSTFTADVASSIMADQTLPSGNWSISGTSSWTQGGNTYSLSASTSAAVHYNATCTATPRFDGGTLTVVVTQGSQTSTVTIKFTACGAFSATKT